MAANFLDSSAVAKLYHQESGSDQVNSLFVAARLTGETVYVSRLAVVEVQSVFVKKVRTGIISVEDSNAFRNRFLSDLRSRLMTVARMRTVHYEEAARLVQYYGFKFNRVRPKLTTKTPRHQELQIPKKVFLVSLCLGGDLIPSFHQSPCNPHHHSLRLTSHAPPGPLLRRRRVRRGFGSLREAQRPPRLRCRKNWTHFRQLGNNHELHDSKPLRIVKAALGPCGRPSGIFVVGAQLAQPLFNFGLAGRGG